MGNLEPETGVWERVYSGNPHEKSKWLTKPSKEGEFNCDMKANQPHTGGLMVEHRAVMREVVSSTPAGPALRVLK